MGDLSILLDADAKELFQTLQQAQNKIAEFAAHSTSQGEKAGLGFVGSLKNAFSGVGDVFSSLKNALTSTAGLLGVGIGVGAGVAEIKSVVEFGAHIEDLSRKTGVNAETLSRWGFAAQKAGTDVDALSKFIGFLEINREKAARGDTEKIAAFERLGSTAERVKDPLLSINDILGDISKGNLNALDLKGVGGRGALEMRQLLEEVGDGTLKLDKSLSALDTKKLKEVQDAFVDLAQSITVGLAPAIVQVFRSLEDHADTFVTHLREAAVQLGALHDAAKTNTPGAFFEALGKGQDETKRLEQDLFNRQTQREEKRILEEAEAKNPQNSKRATITDEADAEAEAKAEKEDKANELDVIGADTESKLDRAEEQRRAREDAARESEKDQEEAEKAKDDAAKEQARKAADAQKAQSKVDQLNQDFAKNPTGVSLHDYATQGSGRVQALAQEAEREEQIARQRQLGGDFKGATSHQDRAEQLKHSLGLKSKQDDIEAVKKGLDESENLKAIRKNTEHLGENK